MDNSEQIYNNPIAEPEHKDVMLMTDEEREFLKCVKWQNAGMNGNWRDPSEQYVGPRYTLSDNGHLPRSAVFTASQGSPDTARPSRSRNSWWRY